MKPVPDWVTEIALNHSVPFAEAQRSGGTQFLLLDEQTRVADAPECYRHLAIRLLTEESVNENSAVTIEFSPEFESLDFHYVRIWRESIPSERLDIGDLRLLQREERMEEQVIDGRWTASLILRDVRKGDILEYAYSVTGQNPALGGHYSARFDLQWSSPLHDQYLRLLWPADREIHVRPVNTNIPLQRLPAGRFIEFSCKLESIAPLVIEDDAPSWYDPWPRFVFSSTGDWGEVADWGRALYARSPSPPEAVLELAHRLETDYSDLEGRTAAALHFVQDEIRYLALAIGSGGYRPQSAAQTLQNRYGDCKAKTYLLLLLLDALGVEAQPALVDTSYGEILPDDGPRVTAFDHIIVHASIGKRQYWLDPTLDNQKGPLQRIWQPDYGWALVLAPDVRELVRMAPPAGDHREIVREVFDLRAGPDHPAELRILTEFIGREAEMFRRRLNSDGRDVLARDYLQHYAGYYPTIHSTGGPEFADDTQGNRITVKEFYAIPGLWVDDPERNWKKANFYTNTIHPFTGRSEVTTRSSPFAFSHPLDITHQVTFRLSPGDWTFPDKGKSITNDFFTYLRTADFNSTINELQVTYRLRSHTKFVPQDRIEEFNTDMKALEDDLDYYLWLPEEASPASGLRAFARTLSLKEWLLLAAVPLSLILMFAALIGLAVALFRRRPEGPSL